VSVATSVVGTKRTPSHVRYSVANAGVDRTWRRQPISVEPKQDVGGLFILHQSFQSPYVAHNLNATRAKGRS
jgi:hypothetical protein